MTRAAEHWSAAHAGQVLEIDTRLNRLRHLKITRHDGRDLECNWETVQAIKNDLVGANALMIEVYPPESDVVNAVPIRHLWELPDWSGCPRNLARSNA